MAEALVDGKLHCALNTNIPIAGTEVGGPCPQSMSSSSFGILLPP